MKSKRHLILPLLILAMVGALVPPVYAQEGDPTSTADEPPNAADGPQTHIVQEGENLTSIAEQYDVTVAELLAVNRLDETSLIYPDQELIIPGTGDELSVNSYVVQVGDTLEALALRFESNMAAIAQANNLVNSDSLYAGQVLTIVGSAGQTLTGTLHVVQPGETLLMLAARHRLTPAQIAEANGRSLPFRLYPGMRLRLPAAGEEFQFLPGSWQAVNMAPVPVVQGETVSIYVENVAEGDPTGRFAGQPLQFSPHGSGYVALAGLDAFAEPGRYLLELGGAGQRSWWPMTEQVQVVSAGYPTQTINVPAELAPLLAPEIRAEEDAFLSTIYSQFTPEQRWRGLFQTPVTDTVVTASYGGIRSYNGGPFDIFHTGVDFGGAAGTPILSPAAGLVVYTGTLQLRGNTVVVDHGLGVMSGYYHLSESSVEIGELVEPGQLVGYGGSTGLSTGPHLHWELRVRDVPVNGLQWTEELFPKTD